VQFLKSDKEILDQMSNEGMSHGIMEGKGAYNKHARLPAGGAALALPLLEKAVQSMQLDTSEQPVVVADYGSSQGKNSMIPIQIAIQGLRRRVGPNLILGGNAIFSLPSEATENSNS
jgi:hypothetical protein